MAAHATDWCVGSTSPEESRPRGVSTMRASLSLRLRTTVLPLVALAAACGESTTLFDPVVLSQNTDQIINAIDDSPAMQSMGVLGEKMTAVAAPGAVIPQEALGKTFTYNEVDGIYVLSDRTGAPTNGVRFILYAVNPFAHTVVTPLTEVGYVDLLDESSTSTIQLHLLAYITASGTTPLIDYTASATIQGLPTPTGATVTATGDVSDGTNTVEFDLSQAFSTVL